jgi:hypothetical protein
MSDRITSSTGLGDAARRCDALDDIDEERDRQDKTFGVQNHHPAYWLAILGKQVGQLGEAIVSREWASKGFDAPSPWHEANAQIREEAVQVAAVAVALIECMDRGDVPDRLLTSQPSDPRQRMRALGRDDETLPYDEVPGNE